MKASLSSAILILAIGIAVNAQETTNAKNETVATPTAAAKTEAAATPAPPAERWDGMLAGFWFNTPSSINQANVAGLKAGLPISSGQGRVIGFEWGFVCTTEYVNGFQWAMLAPAISKELYGVQMSLVNLIEKDLVGAQIGIVNVGEKSGWQFGLVNHGDNMGFQLGLVNFNKNGKYPFMVGVNWNK